MSIFLTKGLVLDDAALRKTAPAIFAEAPAEGLSRRYGFASTIQLVNMMRENGYNAVGAKGGQRARSLTHGLHEVRFRRPDAEMVKGQVFPEIVLLNSHDGTSSSMFTLGLFRVACLNGLVVGETFEAPYRIKHIGDTHGELIKATNALLESVPRISDVIDRWQQRQLNAATVEEFGKRAAELRQLSKRAVVSDVTCVHRDEDSNDNLWNVYNRAQENLVGGGVTQLNDKGRRIRKSRALRAVKPLLDLNRGLWDLAEEFSLN